MGAVASTGCLRGCRARRTALAGCGLSRRGPAGATSGVGSIEGIVGTNADAAPPPRDVDEAEVGEVGGSDDSAARTSPSRASGTSPAGASGDPDAPDPEESAPGTGGGGGGNPGNPLGMGGTGGRFVISSSLASTAPVALPTHARSLAK